MTEEFNVFEWQINISLILPGENTKTVRSQWFSSISACCAVERGKVTYCALKTFEVKRRKGKTKQICFSLSCKSRFLMINEWICSSSSQTHILSCSTVCKYWDFFFTAAYFFFADCSFTPGVACLCLLNYIFTQKYIKKCGSDRKRIIAMAHMYFSTIKVFIWIITRWWYCSSMTLSYSALYYSTVFKTCD